MRALPDRPARRRDLRAEGMTCRQISAQVRRGRLVALRRGVIAPPGPDPDDAAIAATLCALGRDVVVSHAHAARLWGLPSPLGGWPPPALTAVSGPTRRRDGMHVLVAPLPVGDVAVDLPGRLPVTSAARTVADCLRSLPPWDALAIADAAVRRCELTGTALDEALERQRGWPGVVRARVLAGLVDGRRETPLESWSAWSFHVRELPAPRWQVDVRRRDGGFVGRVDALWPHGVVGEADGRAKYRLAAEERGGADAGRLAEVLTEEREREQRLVRLGARIVRWGAGEVRRADRADELADHLRDVLDRAGRDDRFQGLLRCVPACPDTCSCSAAPPDAPPRG